MAWNYKPRTSIITASLLHVYTHKWKYFEPLAGPGHEENHFQLANTSQCHKVAIFRFEQSPPLQGPEQFKNSTACLVLARRRYTSLQTV